MRVSVWAVSQEGPTVRFWPEALGTVVHLLSGEDKGRGRGRRLKPRAHAEHTRYTAPGIQVGMKVEGRIHRA